MTKVQKNSRKEYMRKYREEHREAAKEYARKYRKERGNPPRDKERQKKTTKQWIERHPERRRAHVRVYYALKRGKLTKGRCVECGAEKVHAHHHDYSQPLNVTWLCPIHHFTYDSKAGNRKNTR